MGFPSRNPSPDGMDRHLPPWSVAAPGRIVEAGTGEPGTRDLRPVSAPAPGVRGVEPLGEEGIESVATGAALVGHGLMERDLELRLVDVAAAVAGLDLLQRAVERGRPKDLAQREVGGFRPVVSRVHREEAIRRRVRRRSAPEAPLTGVQRIELLDEA